MIELLSSNYPAIDKSYTLIITQACVFIRKSTMLITATKPKKAKKPSKKQQIKLIKEAAYLAFQGLKIYEILAKKNNYAAQFYLQ